MNGCKKCACESHGVKKCFVFLLVGIDACVHARWMNTLFCCSRRNILKIETAFWVIRETMRIFGLQKSWRLKCLPVLTIFTFPFVSILPRAISSYLLHVCFNPFYRMESSSNCKFLRKKWYVSRLWSRKPAKNVPQFLLVIRSKIVVHARLWSSFIVLF